MAALAAFWMLGVRIYAGLVSEPQRLYERTLFLEAADALGDYLVAIGAVLGLLPAGLLVAAVCDSPSHIWRAKWVMASCAMFMVCLGCGAWIALLDAKEALWIWQLNMDEESSRCLMDARSYRFWLYAALILTTVFVIFASWRQAIWDAAHVVEEVDEE